MIIITRQTDVAKDILQFARIDYVELTPTTVPPTQDGLYLALSRRGREFIWVYVDGKDVLKFDWEGLDELSDYTEWIGPFPDIEDGKEGDNHGPTDKGI